MTEQYTPPSPAFDPAAFVMEIDANPWRLDLPAMAPADVVKLNRYLHDQVYYLEHEADELQHQQRRDARERLLSLQGPIDSYLDYSDGGGNRANRDDDPHRRAVLWRQANGSQCDRTQACYHISSALKRDKDFALMLWGRLLQDPDPDIRATALEELRDAAGPCALTSPDNDDVPEVLGIAWRNIASVLYLHAQAQAKAGPNGYIPESELGFILDPEQPVPDIGQASPLAGQVS